ncbi:MAG: hypothetical protein ABR530_08410 [Pyrinomonadaceae bacterium]
MSKKTEPVNHCIMGRDGEGKAHRATTPVREVEEIVAIPGM